MRVRIVIEIKGQDGEATIEKSFITDSRTHPRDQVEYVVAGMISGIFDGRDAK